MARRVRQDTEANMDSLLDALTNVVGILLLVLILTSLKMSDVVNKIISELQPVTVAELQLNKDIRDKSEEELRILQTQIAERDPVDALEKKNRELALALENMDVSDKLESLADEIAALLKEIEEQEEKKDENIKTVDEKDQELADLKAQLDSIPIIDAPDAEIVTLPDPREAPDRSEPRYIICKEQKLYYVGDCYQHLFAARDFIDSKMQQLVYEGPAPGWYYHGLASNKRNDQDTGWLNVSNRDGQAYVKMKYDREKVLKLFETQASTIGGKHFSYKITPTGDRFRLTMSTRPEGGWTIKDFKRTNSEFDLALKRVQGERHYLYFLVSPDSFQTYTQARQMVEFYRIPAGWTLSNNAEFLPEPSVKRIETEINFDNYFSEAELQAVSSKLTANLKKLQESTQAEVDKITDQALKDYAQSRYANPSRNSAVNIERMAEVASRVRGVEVVRIDPQAPEIPHVRFFSPVAMPKEVPPPPDPKKKKKKGTTPPAPKPPKDILD